MIDGNKAVFLPIDDKILNLFKGFILNGKPLLNIKESDVYTETKYYEFDSTMSKTEKVFRVIFIILFVPIFIIVLIIAALFKKFDSIVDKMEYWLDIFFSIFFNKKKELTTTRTTNKKYDGTIHEDVPEFLNHCKKHFAKVIVYSYQKLTTEQNTKLELLIQAGLVSSFQNISKLSDLIPFLKSESISILNSLLIISNSSEKDEAALLGFHPGNGYQRNVELWKKRKSRSKGGETELEWDSNEALIGMKGKIEYYLKAKNRAFLSNDKVIFIEDSRDEFLNSYIQKHLARISEGISKKNMQLIYFPAFHLDEIKIHKPIFEFIRYRLPIFYSLSDNELEDAIQTVLQKISPQEFYRIVLDELELPFFPRPCLLRNIYGGMSKDKNKFTYKLIEYKSEDDLDKFFDWYINQVSIPNDHAQFSAAKPPAEYDADWNFGSESKEDTAELKQKIDSMKAEGKFGVLADAIMYMLETIKDEKPEILSKVRPLIEKRKLLESKVVLSPILIDKHYNIFLPDFGNIEVKMHALPKTVYILFLRHPKGIRFKELFEHKKELLEIYNMVTNKYEKDEIERAIDDLVDMTKPNINMQCSRIRASFRNLMDEHIAKHYYIDGLNGEPKGIALPKNLIDIRY